MFFCAMPVYMMEKIMVACWKHVAVETICKKGEEVTAWALRQWW